jgi:membrane protein involved in colicin uptake
MLAMAAVGTGSAIMQGEEQKKSANAQADQVEAEGEFQRKQAEADAKTEKQAAELRAEQIRKAGREQRAKARAGAAASGMDVGLGTATELQSEITRGVEEDAGMSIFGGLDAFKRGNQTGQSIGNRATNEATALKAGGKAAQTAGYVGAAKSAVGAYGDYKASQPKTTKK